MSVLTIKGLRKQYEETTVLGGVDLHVGQGEIVSILGPSGCGKSTLLRIVAGLDRHYDGEVEVPQMVGGRTVGVVFQEPRLFPWLTVRQNIAFGSKVENERVEAVAASVGLSGCLNAFPKQLSGGMAQRCAIARALIGKPQLLLFDEPFSALDAFTRRQLHDLVLELRELYNTTMLVVTHDIREALYLSDRIVVLSGCPGRVLREVTTRGDGAHNGALESELLYELGFEREPLHTQPREWVS